MELAVINADGQKTAGLMVSEATFAVDFNEPLVHQVVVAYQAGARSGTRAQKNRAAVRGGGSKPWRQKGTGRARSGTSRSPIWRGGGRTFPTATQNFSQKVNRKMFRAAMRSILSELLRQERLLICEDLQFDEPKTKQLAQRLQALGAADVLIVSAEPNDNLVLSARNLYRVEVCDARTVNPVSLIGHEQVILTAEAAKKIEEWLQ